MMVEPLQTYFFFTLLFLGVHIYQDLKTQEIDTRYNYLMKGLLLGTILWAGLPTIGLFILTVGTILINYFIIKDTFGEGDKGIFLWLATSFYLIGWAYFLVFWVCLGFITMIHIVVKHITKTKGKMPGTPLLLLAYLLTILLYMINVIIYGRGII